MIWICWRRIIRIIEEKQGKLGSIEVLDYKTGRVDPKKWFGERPEDPQLPLYAVSAEEIPYGVVFAVIRNDECVFRGWCRARAYFPGCRPNGVLITPICMMPASRWSRPWMTGSRFCRT